MKRTLVALIVTCAPLVAYAEETPTVTLTDAGPTRDVPTHRSFFVTGDIAATVTSAQAVVVRKGSPTMFGDDGPDCRDVMNRLHVDPKVTLVDDDERDDDEVDDGRGAPRFAPGKHRASDVFPRAEADLQDTEVLVSAPWVRADDANRYQVLVPHDSEFFSVGYAYCMFVVASEHAQQITDDTISTLVDRVARDIVGCGDRSSCDDDALSDFAMRAVREVASTHTLGGGVAAVTVSTTLKDAARSELASSSAIVEARDHLQDRWRDDSVMQPLVETVWADPASNPFAHAVVAALARTSALLPQVHRGSAVELWTPDGKLQVRMIQMLDDDLTVRVASSSAPSGEQARVLAMTTDVLPVAGGITLFDLIELGHGRVHVDDQWISLAALGERAASLGLEWTATDSAFLAAASTQMRRLADFVAEVATNATCPHGPLDTSEASLSRDGMRRAIGDWLACQHIDTAALDGRARELEELARADQSWQSTKDELAARARRIATITVSAPIETRVAFTRPTWVFSYVTPFVGYAGVVRPDESFGVFYLGAQLHVDPNPVEDILWRDGVTTKDLRRAVALELGVAPYGGSFGPEQRYSGFGGVPPVFIGLAFHVVPYTSFTFGGMILDHKNSSLPQEESQAIFTPYVGITLQLNVPDLVRLATTTSSDTTVVP